MDQESASARPGEGSAVVLVTGASSGFGKAVARALHAKGWCVYGASRTDAGERSADGLRTIALDVTSDDSVARGVATVLAEQGRIDALVNNAGVGYAGALEDTSLDEARAQFETNFFGMHRLCRAVLPTMRERRAGRIVNMSSLGGLVSVPFQGFYCASKFAVEAYTEALRMEVRPFGIRVAMIEPGDYATGFTGNRRMAAGAGAGSAYAERCRRAVARMAQDESANSDIGPVVRKVLAVLEAPQPGLRHPVASALQRTLVALRPVLPHSLFEYVITSSYGIR
jgi:NAD(P)-dependent dehydrogenase (short-subunit alcohol dehydrogenase family)